MVQQTTTAAAQTKLTAADDVEIEVIHGCAFLLGNCCVGGCCVGFAGAVARVLAGSERVDGRCWLLLLLLWLLWLLLGVVGCWVGVVVGCGGWVMVCDGGWWGWEVVGGDGGVGVW